MQRHPNTEAELIRTVKKTSKASEAKSTYVSSPQLGLSTTIGRIFMVKRKGKRLGLADCIAGLYVAHYETLQTYWTSTKRLDDLAERCGVSDPRWLHQLEYYHLMSVRQDPVMNRLILYDHELAAVFEEARKLKVGDGRSKPAYPTIINIEDFLFAISKNRTLSLCAEVRNSGLRINILARNRKV